MTGSRLGGLLNSIAQGRLTLATGNSVYNPQPATTSSIDTGTEIATFAAAHGWTTGTMVTSAATVDGLTAGTTYYIRAESSTTVTFYDTLAHAEAGGATGLTNLTATTAVQIIPFGVQSTTILYTPHNGNLLSIPDGTRTKLYTFAELSLALGTLTSGSLYDVFAYDSGGVATLKLGPAWASSTSRGTGAGTTEVTKTNGIYVNAVSITSGPGAGAGRLLGTIRMVSTTACGNRRGGITTQVGGQCFVANVDNQVPYQMAVIDTAVSWSYTTATWRNANGATAPLNGCEYISSVGGNDLHAFVKGIGQTSTSSVNFAVGIGIDSTSVVSSKIYGVGVTSGFANAPVSDHSWLSQLGYHYAQWLEISQANGTTTWYGHASIPDILQSGMITEVMA